ncbi:hypothetical protein ACFQQB_64810 [Nonomuraea rubra]|uniref:hypothetical protein n=1 Tax=Nonomuraea rubra TaxID=46180 RepID=UPI00361C28E3
MPIGTSEAAATTSSRSRLSPRSAGTARHSRTGPASTDAIQGSAASEPASGSSHNGFSRAYGSPAGSVTIASTANAIPDPSTSRTARSDRPPATRKQTCVNVTGRMYPAACTVTAVHATASPCPLTPAYSAATVAASR